MCKLRFPFLSVCCLAALLLAPMLAMAADAGYTGNIVLSEDFETNPLNRGWTVQIQRKNLEPPQWIDSERHQGKHAIRAVNGTWESPSFPVEAFAYYGVTFYAKTSETGGVWAVAFYE